MNLLRVAARVATGTQPAKVEMAIYDNTRVSPEELVDEVLAIGFSPIWFAQHDFGWLAVSQDPASLSPETPVEGAPFGEGTFGEVVSNGYADGMTEFRRCDSPEQALEDKGLLWWMTSGDQADQKGLAEALTSSGLAELTATVESFEL